MFNKFFGKVFFVLSILVLLIIALRSWFIPLCHDEAATFFYYIQTGTFLPFSAHVDANNHVLNSAASFVFYKMFGSHPFVLRLPNLIAFIMLAFGTWRLTKRYESPFSKCILVAGFLLSFHFLAFFSVCRGYGISMAFFVLSLSFFLDYMQHQKLSALLLFLVCFQLAVSAGLILVIVFLPFIFFALLKWAFSRKQTVLTVLFHALNLVLVYFWVKFSFFLQDNHALYYGAGGSYFATTFRTLFMTIFDNSGNTISYSVVAFTVLVIITTIIVVLKERKVFKEKITSDLSLVFLCLFSVVIGFYLLKKLFGVNYPEDRTGLFFYVLFIVWMAALADNIKKLVFIRISASLLSTLVLVHFASNLNFRKHSLVYYETIPQAFYDYLLQEQQRSKERLNFSGHFLRELMFAFQNYRAGSPLNLVDATEALYLNGDYGIAKQYDKPWYDKYYAEVLTEPDWGYVLIKRKEKIKKILTKEIELNSVYNGSDQFFNLYAHVTDTIISNQLPMLAEVDFSVDSTENPTLSWIVLQVDTLAGSSSQYYKRIPFNWLRSEWAPGETYTYGLFTGALNKKINSMALYLYNFSGQRHRIRFHKVRFYELSAPGISEKSAIAG